MTSIKAKESEVFEMKELEYKNVKVLVRIDYRNRGISFIERVPGHSDNIFNDNQVTRIKQWVFVNRGPEYMDGWNDILDAMKYAAGWAKRKFKEYDAKLAEEKKELEGKIVDHMAKLADHAKNIVGGKVVKNGKIGKLKGIKKI